MTASHFTARLALPYPDENDPADVPLDLANLVNKLDPIMVGFKQGTTAARPAAGTPGLVYYATDANALFYDIGTSWRFIGAVGVVGALPPSPIDGQECYYEADAANLVVWHLKYRAAIGDAYKWQFVGGQPITQYDGATVTPGYTGGWTGNLQPAITLPAAFGGIWRLRVKLDVGQTVAGVVGVYFGMEQASAPTVSIFSKWSGAQTSLSASTSCTVTFYGETVGLVAGAQMRMMALITGNGIQWYNKSLEVAPVRVG